MLIMVISAVVTAVIYAAFFKKLPATKWIRVPVAFPGAVLLWLTLNAMQGIGWALITHFLQAR